MSLEQALCAAYSLTQSVKVEPRKDAGTQLGTTVGLGGEFDCANCFDWQKLERGGCPFVAQPKRGEVPQMIDSTGDERHDWINRCPRSITLESPALNATLRTFNEAQNCGGPGAYFKPPLCEKSKGFTTALSVLVATESRLQNKVRSERRRLDSAT